MGSRYAGWGQKYCKMPLLFHIFQPQLTLMVNSYSYSGWVQIDLLLFPAKLFLEPYIMMGLTTENSVSPVLSDTFASSVSPCQVCYAFQQIHSKPNFAFSKHLPWLSLSPHPCSCVLLITMSSKASPHQTSAPSLPLEQHPLNLLRPLQWCMDQYLDQSNELFWLMELYPTCSIRGLGTANWSETELKMFSRLLFV